MSPQIMDTVGKIQRKKRPKVPHKKKKRKGYKRGELSKRSAFLNIINIATNKREK
jgi:hypothetical protein